MLSIYDEILSLSNCKISRHYIAKVERYMEEFLYNGLNSKILCEYIERICKTLIYTLISVSQREELNIELVLK